MAVYQGQNPTSTITKKIVDTSATDYERFRIMNYSGTDDNIELGSDATKAAAGILAELVSTTENQLEVLADINNAGHCKVQLLNDIASVGIELQQGTDGKALTYTTGDFSIGKSVTTGVAGDIILVDFEVTKK